MINKSRFKYIFNIDIYLKIINLNRFMYKVGVCVQKKNE